METKFFKNRPIERLQFLNKNQQESDCSLLPAEGNRELAEREPIHFETHFQGYMDMYSDLKTVAKYLDAHEDWFYRCAQPMKVEPLGKNGYTLTVGHFNSLGYEVEPKINIVLESQKEGIYLMHTIQVPDYKPPGYEVDYQAWMKLRELPTESILPKIDKKLGLDKLPAAIARVEWELHMKVAVKFPKFIYRFPLSVIQITGDRLLNQIVSQVSPRLTYKVQKDFHSGLDLPLPPKNSRNCQKISPASARAA